MIIQQLWMALMDGHVKFGQTVLTGLRLFTAMDFTTITTRLLHKNTSEAPEYC